MSNEIDTSNDYFVGTTYRNNERVLVFPLVTPSGAIPKDKALRLAAWIVAIMDDDDEFPAVLEAVQNT